MTAEKKKSRLLFKIFFHFVSIVIIFIILLATATATLYKTFVINAKERQMVKIFNDLKGQTVQSIAEKTDDINFSYNIRLYVTDENLDTVASGGFGHDRMLEKQGRGIIESYGGELSEKGYMFIEDNSPKPPDSMIFFGRLDNGGYMVAILSYFFVKENLGYSIYFILMFSVVAIILCGIVSYMLAKRISTPIINITDIAQKMTSLDFSAKCSVSSNDELGALAESVNTLSEELERNITDLRHEIEKERKIDEMRKNLIINVSHELKTPIFLIQSYAEGLERNISGSEEDKNYYCSVIKDESERMGVMVKELLNLAKLEAGKEEMHKTGFDLRDFVLKTVKKHSISIANKNARLSVDVPEREVYGDYKTLSDALNNLIVNAIDYVNEGGEIRISCAAEKNSVILKVYNSGSHIAEDELQRIWESFYKVDKSRTRGYGGTGIGLSLVRAVMNEHGTGCGAENTEDGVEFYMEIKKAEG